ncbi:MAG: hypothetical protein A2086_08510 [Spirochaetes bacterium GWD1_27_9]|nr:MAG: hypothetical protein A2Z98_18085 [Spirochaetes bacterium GWB1_27_13]OHD23130.1 MAG: hypothetical protein A2Y34_16695 [Spirochaetes bacterium GWC1_27_15]OHD40284.1 MAG: hypothetical protein A2086_08510 [Spirochaetes bacterium GWD1_27_9]
MLSNFEILNNESGKVEFFDNKIVIDANPATDCYISPYSEYNRFNAFYLYKKIKTNFIVSVLIKPDFKETYDAGCLVIYKNSKKYIKFCFEKTDLGYPAVVSVITNDRSDDCNGIEIKDSQIWLRVVRKNSTFGLYYSFDGINWFMHRLLNFLFDDELFVGIQSQSPAGNGCKSEFFNFEIENKEVTNLKKGI